MKRIIFLFFVFTFSLQSADIMVQLGHQGAVNSIVISPDSTCFATIAKDRTCKVWETESGKLINVFKSVTLGVKDLKFSLGGDSLFISNGKDVITWDFWNNKIVKEDIFNITNITCLDVHGYNKKIIVGGIDGQVVISDYTSSDHYNVPKKSFNNEITFVGFSKDQQFYIVGTVQGNLEIYSINATWKTKPFFSKKFNKRINQVSLYKDILTVIQDSELIQINLRTKQEIIKYQTTSTILDYSENKSEIITTEDTKLFRYSLISKKYTDTLNYEIEVTSAKLLNDDRILVGFVDGTLKYTEFNFKSDFYEIPSNNNSLVNAIINDSKLILSYDNGKIKISDLLLKESPPQFINLESFGPINISYENNNLIAQSFEKIFIVDLITGKINTIKALSDITDYKIKNEYLYLLTQKVLYRYDINKMILLDTINIPTKSITKSLLNVTNIRVVDIDNNIFDISNDFSKVEYNSFINNFKFSNISNFSGDSDVVIKDRSLYLVDYKNKSINKIFSYPDNQTSSPIIKVVNNNIFLLCNNEIIMTSIDGKKVNAFQIEMNYFPTNIFYDKQKQVYLLSNPAGEILLTDLLFDPVCFIYDAKDSSSIIIDNDANYDYVHEGNNYAHYIQDKRIIPIDSYENISYQKDLLNSIYSKIKKNIIQEKEQTYDSKKEIQNFSHLTKQKKVGVKPQVRTPEKLRIIAPAIVRGKESANIKIDINMSIDEIKDIKIIINGKELKQIDKWEFVRKLLMDSVKIELKNGKNEVVVKLTDKNGVISKHSSTISMFNN